MLVGIAIVNTYGSGFLSFKQYSKRICDFTKAAHEGSTIILVAGDMDFFGGFKVEQEEVALLMEKNEEYEQLRHLNDKIRLRILCNNKLEEKVFHAIMKDTIRPKSFLMSIESERNWEVLHFSSC